MKSSIHYIIILGSFLLSTLIVSSSIGMEKVNLGYSTKNIPLPSRSEYMKNFIEKTEHFLRRMRWKAYHFLNPTESTTKETYGFKSPNSPLRVNELIPFEDGMLNLIQNIQVSFTIIVTTNKWMPSLNSHWAGQISQNGLSS